MFTAMITQQIIQEGGKYEKKISFSISFKSAGGLYCNGSGVWLY
jgi:hypothetical protein